MEYLRDQIWTFIGILVTIILFIISYYITKRISRKRMSISYQILTNSPLFTKPEMIKNHLEILYKGQIVDNLSFVSIKISNTGTTSLDKSAFIKYITIEFDEKTKIVNNSVNKRHPENMNLDMMSMINHENIFGFKPDLFNSGDYVIFDFTVSGYTNTPLKVIGRIKGISEIKEITNQVQYYHKLMKIGALFIVTAFINFGVNYLLEGQLTKQNIFLTFILILSFLFSLILEKIKKSI